MTKIQTVIMAGGLGTRLWPLSTRSQPKQFIKGYNGNSSLQETLIRNKSFGKQLVIVGQEHSSIAVEQIREVNVDAELIVEPLSKNTAPCAIIASLIAIENNCDAVLLLPSDLYISDSDKYLSLINEAFNYIDSNIVTIGIRPTSPHTGYGYIKTTGLIRNNIYKAEKFVEKPDLAVATSYLSQNNYFWNSGIFIFEPEYMLDKAAQLQPSMLSNITESLANASKDFDFIMLNKTSYEKIDELSVDYAIMEDIQDIILLEANFSWNDLGNWESLWEASTKDADSNYIQGNTVTRGVTNSYISSNAKLTTVIGLSNIIVINTNDATLIANKEQSEQVKQVVQQLHRNKEI